jgi:catechol 2,3-dioxygenase-like lactoylglutathione lyase family enzyme
MTIKRLDHVSVVVDDLAAAIAFFTALGMTIEGEMPGLRRGFVRRT